MLKPEKIDRVDFSVTPGSRKAVASKEAGVGRGDLLLVPVDDIHVIPDFNVRLDGPELRAHIRMLADSIKTSGFKRDKPLAGYPGKKDGKDVILLSDGHCRLDAVKIAIAEGAPIDRIPVVLTSEGANIEDLTADMAATATQRGLSRLEFGIVCKRLANFGWSLEQIAARSCRVKASVEDALLLVGAAPEIRNWVIEGKISDTFAIDTMKEHGEEAIEVLRAAIAKAEAAGAPKAMPKHAPDAAYKKAVKKTAPVMAETLSALRTDPGYARISKQLRERIDELIGQLEQAKAKAGSAEAENDGEPQAEAA